MKQLYHTSCKKGKSVNGNSGFQVRAVSADVPDARIRTLSRYAGYQLPWTELGAFPKDQWPQLLSDTPTRLAYLNSKDSGRLICHAVDAGQDPATGRDGNYFSHVVFDLPESVTPLDVLKTWGSDQWMTRDDDSIEQQLGSLNQLPADGTLNDESLTAFAADADQRELLAFVFGAWLNRQPEGRIYIAANSREIAICAYALARCMPPELLEGFSFSTFESHPLTSFADVIGTWWWNKKSGELPGRCYTGNSFGFNRFTGRRAPETPASHHVEFLVQACVENRLEDIDRFYADENAAVRSDAQKLNAQFRLMAAPESLSPEEFELAIESESARRRMLASATTVARLTGLAMDDPSFHANVLCPLLSEAEPASLAPFYESALAILHEAVEGNDLARLESALGEFSSELPRSVGRELAERFWPPLDPDQLAPPTFAFLAPLAIRYFTDQNDDEKIDRWLTRSPEQLPALLAGGLETSCKIRACMNFLGDSQARVGELSRMLQNQPQLVLPLMQEIVQRPTIGEAGAVELFSQSLQGQASRQLAGELMAGAVRLPTGVFQSCFSACLRAKCIDPMQLVKGKWSAHQLADEDYTYICEHLLEKNSVEEITTDTQTLSFLSVAVNQAKMRPTVQGDIEQLLVIGSYLTQRREDYGNVASVAAAIDGVVHKKQKGRIAMLAAERFYEIWSQQKLMKRTWLDLEQFIASFAKFVSFEETYQTLISIARRDNRLWSSTAQLHAILACGYGVSANGAPPPWGESLMKYARKFAELIADKSGRTTFVNIVTQSRDWPKYGGQRPFDSWLRFARSIEPPSMLQRVTSFFFTTEADDQKEKDEIVATDIEPPGPPRQPKAKTPRPRGKDEDDIQYL